MANKTVTAANVLASAPALKTTNGIAGATITQGQVLYKMANNQFGLCGATGTEPANVLAGIALNAASAGQPVAYCTSDPTFTPGCPVAIGEVLIVSATPGAEAPIGDAATGDYITILGVGIGNNQINFSPVAAGVASTTGFST